MQKWLIEGHAQEDKMKNLNWWEGRANESVWFAASAEGILPLAATPLVTKV